MQTIGRYELHGAVEDLGRAIELEPDRGDAYAFRSRVWASLREPDAALDDAERAIALGAAPGALSYAYQTRGRHHARARRRAEALADYGEALRLAPGNVDAHYDRATLRAAMGQLEGAVADMDALIAVDASDPTVWSDRGTYRGRLGDLHGAIADWERAIELEPNGRGAQNARINIERARAMLAQGE